MMSAERIVTCEVCGHISDALNNWDYKIIGYEGEEDFEVYCFRCFYRYYEVAKNS